MKKNRMLISLLVFVFSFIFMGCEQPSTKPDNAGQKLSGQLVISRLYIGTRPEASDKFFAITNTGGSPVDLKDVRVVFSPALKDGAVFELPDAKLAGGKTLWCFNGWGMSDNWKDRFPGLSTLPVVGANVNGKSIDKDSIWYGIKGNYVKNTLSLGIVVNEKIDIIDTAPAFSKPCAYLRSLSDLPGKDNGWFTLTWNDSTDRKSLVSGIVSGIPDIKPVAPGPDMDRPEEITGDIVSKAGSTKTADNVHLGYPQVDIKQDPENENHFLIERDCYVLSYNRELHNPNWVSWHLQSEDMGSGRYDAFHHETRLPKAWNEVLGIYTNSGFSKGHMCSNGERNGNGTAYDTFSMANMLPQTQGNNGGAWNGLENYIISKCRGNKEAYIVSGGYGSGGIGRNGTHVVKSFRDTNGLSINVPAVVWKVVIIMDRNDNGSDKARIEADYENQDKVEAFAVWMPNDETKCKENDKDWKQHAVSIDYVEEMTGFDFFSVLNDAVEDYLESLDLYTPAAEAIVYEAPDYSDAA